MNKVEMEQEILRVLVSDSNISDKFEKFILEKVREKTEEQLQYILLSINQNVFLEACAGSGKTEVVGMKAAYEINRWNNQIGGLAILTFTNEATETIQKRVNQFLNRSSLYPHYIGTLTGFIHGYISQSFGSIYIKNNKSETNRSYSLIEKDTSVFNNSWLTKYKFKTQYLTNSGGKLDIYAHQVYYDNKIEDFIINLFNTSVSLKEYYESKVYQDFVQALRAEKQQPWLLQYEYIKDQFKENKAAFYKDGFANFEDMYHLAYYVLKNNSFVAKQVVRRFPVIIIDECQDLSWVELAILKILDDAGATLHFVGDLNQAIYEFKDADPESTLEAVATFNCLKLTNNFRSHDSIVKVSTKVASISQKMTGHATCNFVRESVCYYEYNDIQSLKDKYIKFLKANNIAIKDSTMLVRQQKLKDILGNSQESPHPILEAMHLWNKGVPSNQIQVLELVGQGLQKYFGVTKNKRSYYCPVSVDSLYRWRIFLKEYLNLFNEYPELMTFDNKTYGEWYKLFRENAINIINKAYKNLKPYDKEERDFSKIKIICPSGTAKNNIILNSITSKGNYPEINTIHAAKGKEYDSVMVISSERNTGQGDGHWKKWIDEKGEGRRIGYVANSRAKYSLVWAVPILTDAEKSLIESYGFKPLEI